MTLRAEQAGDAAAISALLTACFPTPDEARLVERLRADGDLAVSLVEEDQGLVVGHVAFSPLDAAGGVGLAPVAVARAHRRRGVAEALIREGLARCRARGDRFCVVLGEPAYYGRFGFRPAREVGLVDEYGGGDAFQALELVPGGLPRDHGLVRYAKAFATLAAGR